MMKQKNVKASADTNDDISDEAVIQLLMTQGRTEKQAECAVNLLKMFKYGLQERYQILSDSNSKIHRLCYFGSLIPIVVLVLAVLILIGGVIYQVLRVFEASEEKSIAINISDESIIQLMMLQDKSENQARCAVDYLKRLQYNPHDRHQILLDPNSNVHRLCYFGSLAYVFQLTLTIMLVICIIIKRFFFRRL